MPDAPAGARVDGLWTHDVVECLLVGADGRYLELELGAGGHWLVLAFDAPRRPAERAERLAVSLDREGRAWTARCALPRAWLPEPLVRVNAFAHAGGELLAHHPLPGDAPDFHQPAAFPALRVPCWEP